MDIDIDALRREAKGAPLERVVVTRRYLAELLARIEQKAALDVLAPPLATGPTRDFAR